MNLLDLIRSPHAYFEALKRLPPASWRLVWLPIVAGLLGGLSGALLSRSVLDSQTLLMYSSSGLRLPSSLLWSMTILLSGVLSFISWLVLWGMGQLGAGKEARSGEVYGASFLAPLLWSLVLAGLALLFPPQVTVSTPDLSGLQGTALLTAVQKYTAAVQTQYGQSPVVRFSTFMGYAVYLLQFWLAYIGFRTMVPEDRRRAWRGVVYPAMLFLVLGAAALLVAGAVVGLAGGLL
ncbi:hypothetical protein MF271_09380 [Deinococcus sp. KNUC1210]|uniref:hypothetical protein n=1 Tax=Deinococcus sp. KNUC1210 TaxID=2917691 RepID=UPI001EF11204|nr:hypothetical protein [Deinococcus sp. KNUC1210]ULH16755.1 hypothetical protein MF271_09380 [Deinococcus sp. KNUC1210]